MWNNVGPLGDYFKHVYSLCKDNPYLHIQLYKVLNNYIQYLYIHQKVNEDVISDVYNMIQEIKTTVPVLSQNVQAIFKEEHAVMHLRLKPVFFRKYYIYLVMAGYCYSQLKLFPHAIRCYSVARLYTAHFNWKLINEFLLSQLAYAYKHIHQHS